MKMKSPFRLICLLLAFALAISLIGCKGAKPTADASSTPSEVVSSEEETIPEEVESTEPDEEKTEEWSDPDAGTTDELLINEIVIDNVGTPIQENSLGFNGIYSLFPFLEVSQNRTYTEKQAMREIELIRQMGVKMVRSFYSTKYAYDTVKKAYDWESKNMQGIYRYMKELQKADIKVGINAGWQLGGFINYKPNMEMDPYYEILVEGDEAKTARNYANWMVTSLNQFKAHGCNNVKYVFMFTEPGGFNSQRLANPEQFANVSIKDIEDPHFDTWLRLTKALDKRLKDAGIRKDYQLVGPNEAHYYESQVDGTYYLPMFYQALTQANDYIDIYSHHNYLPIVDLTSDVVAENVQLYWKERVDLTRELTGKPFWIDEDNIRNKASDSAGGIRMDDPWQGLQLAVMASECMNIGVQNTILWSLASQQWGGTGHGEDHWINGVHDTGLIPSIYVSSVPRIPYYGISLITKYFGRGTVYEVEEGWMHATCEQSEDDEWTVLVINMEMEEATFSVDFAKGVGDKTFYRYVYDTAKQVATADAVPIGADLGIKSDDGKFYDKLPGASFAVYTTRKPE